MFARSNRQDPHCHLHHVFVDFVVYQIVPRRTRATRTSISYRHHLSQTNGIGSQFVNLSGLSY